MTYDVKCYKLAAEFLEDHPEKNTEENRVFLAESIQKEIEDTIEYWLQPKENSTL